MTPSSPKSPKPPAVGRWLVRLRPLGGRRSDVEADLRELFEGRAVQRGRGYAARRYLADAASLFVHRMSPDTHRPASWRRAGGHVRKDLVFALRLFRRQPGLFGMAIGGLALAIGLSTAVFSVVNAAFFRDTGIRDGASVFRLTRNMAWGLPLATRITGTSPTSGNWAFSEFRDAAPAVKSMELAAAAVEHRPVRTPDARPTVPATGRAVTGNYFSLLGGATIVGRAISSADDAPGAPPVIVLAYPFWKNVLGADRAIVGQTVWLEDAPFTVIGVADGAFVGPASPTNSTPPAYWITLNALADDWGRRREAEAAARRDTLDALENESSGSNESQRASLEAELSLPSQIWNPAVDVVGRLRAGAAPPHAQAEISAALASLGASPSPSAPANQPAVRLDPGRYRMRGELALTGIVLGIVGLVVLIAAANVTNVLLANAVGRTREIGTRLAIGASRGRVVRQLLTESLLLGTLSGVLGFVLAMWLTPLLARLIPMFNLEADPTVFGFVTGLTLIVGTIAGLAPARYVRRGDLMSALKTDRLGAPRSVRPGRLRSTLIAIQAAASIVLLVLAALLARSVVQATSMDLGYDADRVAAVSVNLGRSYTEARTRAFWNAALPRLHQLPAVAGAALATPAPFVGQVASRTTDGRYLHRVLASEGYFAAMGQRTIAGRVYTDDDMRANAPVAVISESLARRYWGSENPLGSALERVWGPDDPAGAAPRGLVAKPAGTRVIGVVSDAVLVLANVDRLCVYLPLRDDALRFARLVVRTESNAADLTGAIRDVLRSIDADPLLSVRTSVVRDELNRELLEPKVLAILSAVTGGTALALAVVGLFGVTAFAVGQREHEVGVRLTLGATAGQILVMLMRDSLRPVIIGLGGGLVLALLLGRAVESTLYGVSGHDPVAVLAAIAVLLAAASAAILIPARRTARISPSQMLRES